MNTDAIPSDVIGRYLERNEGWTWTPERGGFTCPAGNPVVGIGARQQSRGSLLLLFRGFKRHCVGCDIRHRCSSTTSRHYRKELSLTLTPDQIRAITETGLQPVSRPESSWQWIPPSSPQRRFAAVDVRGPTLLPAELRKFIDRECWSLHTAVRINPGPELPKVSSPYIAVTSSKRQRRRQTWTERRAWNALADSASVVTTLKGSPNLARLFGAPE